MEVWFLSARLYIQAIQYLVTFIITILFHFNLTPALMVIETTYQTISVIADVEFLSKVGKFDIFLHVHEHSEWDFWYHVKQFESEAGLIALMIFLRYYQQFSAQPGIFTNFLIL